MRILAAIFGGLGVLVLGWAFLNAGIGQMGAVAAESSRTFERFGLIALGLLVIAGVCFALSFLKPAP